MLVYKHFENGKRDAAVNSTEIFIFLARSSFLQDESYVRSRIESSKTYESLIKLNALNL